MLNFSKIFFFFFFCIILSLSIGRIILFLLQKFENTEEILIIDDPMEYYFLIFLLSIFLYIFLGFFKKNLINFNKKLITFFFNFFKNFYKYIKKNFKKLIFFNSYILNSFYRKSWKVFSLKEGYIYKFLKSFFNKR